MALIDNYTKEELEQIVQQSFSFREVATKLGYSATSGNSLDMLRKRIKSLNISIEHFTHKAGIKRTVENVFIKDSTANQSTLRKFYLQGEYTPYICSICGQPPEWQGKELTLILDHINGHNKDDRLENLRWVCPNCNQQLDTTGSKRGFAHLKEVKKYYCVDCGKEISKGATRCPECDANQRKEKTREAHSLTRESLKELIRTTPFVKIGEQFGVSDNAVRRWCDGYGLPRKKTDINKYTDEEWEVI